MILVEGEKYACIQCIRGHRSSTCQHTERPLVQVRSRGRPSNMANYRIAVFAADGKKHSKLLKQNESSINGCASAKRANDNGGFKVEKPKPYSCKAGCSCCPTKSLATDGKVIVVRASKKSLVDVSNGLLKIVGPCKSNTNEPTLSTYTLNPLLRYKKQGGSGSLKSCCSKKSNRESEIINSCCSSTKSEDKTFDFKDNCSVIKLENYSNESKLEKACSNESTDKGKLNIPVQTGCQDINNAQYIMPVNEQILNFSNLHDTCSCDDNCSCDSCVVHGNFKKGAIESLPSLYQNSFEPRQMETQTPITSYETSDNYNFSLNNNFVPYSEPDFNVYDQTGISNHASNTQASMTSSMTTINNSVNPQSPVYQQNEYIAQPYSNAPYNGDSSEDSKTWLNNLNTSVVYDFIFANSCTIPGSCACDSDCACEGCVVHSKSKM